MPENFFGLTPFLGHQPLRDHLMSRWQENRLPRNLLFVGPRDLGKKRAARWIAQHDLCPSTANRPCQQCASCRQIAEQRHPNVIFLQIDDDDGKIQIETVRQTLARFTTAVMGPERRWLIIHEIENLTEGAANAMLKFLEEPPPALTIIATCSDPERMIGTIRSRFHLYRWHLVSGPILSAALTESYPNLSPARRRNLVDRAAGRPSLLRRLSGYAEALEQDEQQAANIIVSLQSTPPVNHPTVPEDLATYFRIAELVLREILLRQQGITNRLLWPNLRSSIDKISKSMAGEVVINKWQRLINRDNYFRYNLSEKIFYYDWQIT